MTGMTNIYRHPEIGTIIANSPSPHGPTGPQGAARADADTSNFYTKTQTVSSSATKENLLNNSSVFTVNVVVMCIVRTTHMIMQLELVYQ